MAKIRQGYNYNMNTRIQEIEKLCRDYNIMALYVFGSRAGDLLRALEHNPYSFEPSASDLDIGILTQSHFSVENKDRKSVV